MNSVVEVPSAVVSPHVESRVSQRTPTATAAFQCLVVSGEESRRDMLSRAAELAGWETVVCADARTGYLASERRLFRLAMIDVAEATADVVEEIHRLSERLSGAPDLLLMICGNEGDALEEIWARQLGAWLYLPGVAEQCDVEGLCREAIPVAERLNGGSQRFAEHAA